MSETYGDEILSEFASPLLKNRPNDDDQLQFPCLQNAPELSKKALDCNLGFEQEKKNAANESLELIKYIN